MESEQNDSAPTLTEPERQLAEVFVCGDQDGPSVGCEGQHVRVGDAGAQLSHVEDLVALVPQARDDLLLDALVANEVHAASSGTG